MRALSSLLSVDRTAGLEDSEIRRLSVLQFCALAGVASMFAYAGIHLLASARALAGPICLSLGCVIPYALVMALNRAGRHGSAKALLCTTLTASIFLSTWFFLGRGPGMHFFFLLAAVVPLLLWRLHDWLPIAFFMTASLAGFVLVQFRADEAAILVHDFPARWTVFYNVMSIVATYATTVAILVYFQTRADEDARNLDARARAMEELMRKYEALAKTDALTGLLNRRAMLLCLQEEEIRMSRNHEVYSLALFDIDHFKDVNDSHGHDAGDLALVGLARLLSSSVREMDRVARWGGEEFLVLFPDTGLEGAAIAAEKIRSRVEAAEFACAGGLRISFTVTAGVVSRAPGRADLDATISRADAALYEGKRGGRNRVVAVPADGA